MMLFSVVFLIFFGLAIVIKQSMQRKWDRDEIKRLKVNVLPPKLLANPEDYAESPLHWLALGLAGKRPFQKTEIVALAGDPLLRYDVFRMLLECEALGWFPDKYATLEAMAESHMVRWLNFPTELGCVPSQIKLLSKETISYENQVYDYYCFCFKVKPPHDMAKQGWMVGCVGPFVMYDNPFVFPKGTFSRFNQVDESKLKQEAEWTFHNIYLNNPSLKK